LLAFHIEGTESGHDIVLLPLGSEDTQSLIDGPFDESWLTLSPDGRWGAYQSNESGRWEIWVTPLSGQGLRRQISTDGGNGPVWSSQGELFFRNGDEFLLVAPGEAGEDWGTPQVLFHGTYRQYARFRTYDVASDGQRFLVIQELESPRVSRLRLVLNWFESMGS
jgi:hypothetical protein